jgi:hypothetical protein
MRFNRNIAMVVTIIIFGVAFLIDRYVTHAYDSDPASTKPPVTAPPASAPPAASANPAGPNALATHGEDWSTTLQDGSKYSGRLTFGPIVPANSDQAAEIAAQFSQGMPCEVDPTRDGLAYGQVSVHNDTPQFSSRFGMGFSLGQGLDPIDVGVGFTNGARCTDNSERLLNINPDFSSPDWGPVPALVVIHDLYTPAHPKGDPEVLTNDWFSFILQGTVKSDGPLLQFEPAVIGGLDGARAGIDPKQWSKAAQSG